MLQQNQQQAIDLLWKKLNVKTRNIYFAYCHKHIQYLCRRPYDNMNVDFIIFYQIYIHSVINAFCSVMSFNICSHVAGIITVMQHKK